MSPLDRNAPGAARALSLGIELHAAAKSGETRRIALLLKHGADVDARMPNGWTPLHTAARRGRSAAVEALVMAGANPDARAEGAVTPLHLAAITADPVSIDALVQAGADRAAKDAEGLLPIDILPRSVPERVREACRPGDDACPAKFASGTQDRPEGR